MTGEGADKAFGSTGKPKYPRYHYEGRQYPDQRLAHPGLLFRIGSRFEKVVEAHACQDEQDEERYRDTHHGCPELIEIRQVLVEEGIKGREELTERQQDEECAEGGEGPDEGAGAAIPQSDHGQDQEEHAHVFIALGKRHMAPVAWYLPAFEVIVAVAVIFFGRHTSIETGYEPCEEL